MPARLWWCSACLTVTLSLFAQSYTIRTVAGFGTFGGDNGPATAALVAPQAVAVDANGVIYVADNINYRIRKIDTAGNISTVIGKGYGAFSGDEGAAVNATMSTAAALALDNAGNLYFSDAANQRIREVTTAGIVRTVAGNGTCGTPAAGMSATQAPLCDVEGVAVDAQGRVLFGSNGQLWMISNGTLALVAGTGGAGNTGDGGPATAAEIGFPASLAADAAGNVYIADQFNFVIREVTADKTIHTVTTIDDFSASTVVVAVDASGALEYAIGTKQVFKIAGGAPVGTPTTQVADYIAVDRAGAIYISSLEDERLMKITGGSSAVIAGAYPLTLDALPQPATQARLNLNAVLIGLAIDATGNLYVPELGGNLAQRIDKVTPSGTISALATPAKLPTNANFTAHAVAIGPDGAVYFSTTSQVYRLDSGSVTLIAGAPGLPTNLGDGGPATAAKISSAAALAFDGSGNLYIADPFDSRVRKVTPQGTITTFAGNGQAGSSGDGGLAVNAKLSTPVDVKVDSAGNVYIADLFAAVVRKVTPDGVITTVAGNGTHGFSGDQGPATQAELSGPAAIAIDASGNLFIADRNQAAANFVPTPDNNRIRMVNSAGLITTIAGGFPGYNGEGILSTSAAMGGPQALATDAQGNVYVAETNTQRVRKLSRGAAASRRRSCCSGV